jgi:excinuclease ABC subunit A
LEVKYPEKDIDEILDMTVDEAVEFFRNSQAKIADKIQPLQDVGLGYIKLGQASNTLSGGEAQRVKLAFFLGKGNADKGKTLFIFDEPTTGLHFHDIKKLMKSFNALIEKGHSILVIEHNLDVVKCADWIIDLGPEAGDVGGNVVFEGIPEDLATSKASITGNYLKGKLN